MIYFYSISTLEIQLSTTTLDETNTTLSNSMTQYKDFYKNAEFIDIAIS